MEYKFFKKGSKHEQTLYYFSTNVRNTDFDPNFKKYLDITLPKHTVGTYLKAASYMMHWTTFSDIRNYILDNSLAVIQDDSGIAYKHFDDRFDITLYGIYKHPLPSFDKRTYQPDLMKAYTENADKVKTLPFYIGYNDPSNWLCNDGFDGKCCYASCRSLFARWMYYSWWSHCIISLVSF